LSRRYINYGLFIVIGPPIAIGIERAPWVGLWHFSAKDWVILFIFAAGVYMGANLLQQTMIRKLGTPLVSIFLGVRVLAAVLGGIILLGEQVRGVLQWLGLLMVGGTATCYLYVQYQKRKQVTMAAVAAAEAAAAAAEAEAEKGETAAAETAAETSAAGADGDGEDRAAAAAAAAAARRPPPPSLLATQNPQFISVREVL
jgi:hypothetical protein